MKKTEQGTDDLHIDGGAALIEGMSKNEGGAQVGRTGEDGENGEDEKDEEEEEEEDEEDGDGNDEAEETNEDGDDEEGDSQLGVMDKFDANEDGTLTFREIASKAGLAAERKDAFLAVFAHMDQNKDSRIDRVELAGLVQELSKAGLSSMLQTEEDEDEDEDEDENDGEVDASSWMKDLDKDKDGQLTLEEFEGQDEEATHSERKEFADVFKLADQNKDNKIDMREMPGALAELDKRDL